MATKKKARKQSRPKPTTTRKSVRQPRLPGMADAKLEALHDAALCYAEIRDERQELTKQEVDLKQRLLDLMHRHKKDHYEYNGVTVDLVTEQETVKVRIKRQKADDDGTDPDVNVTASSPEASDVELEPEPAEVA